MSKWIVVGISRWLLLS